MFFSAAFTPRSKPKGIFCRFFAFRSLRVSQKGVLQSNGFMLPEQASKTDMAEWSPSAGLDVDPMKNPADLAKRWNPETAVYILANVGDEFCELKEQVSSSLKALIGVFFCKSDYTTMDRNGVKSTLSFLRQNLFPMSSGMSESAVQANERTEKQMA